jgi:hypothetical protein
MPKIAELRKIDGAIWARLDVDLDTHSSVSLLTAPELQAIRKDEREGCIEVISWFENVEKFTVEDIIKRIRSVL